MEVGVIGGKMRQREVGRVVEIILVRCGVYKDRAAVRPARDQQHSPGARRAVPGRYGTPLPRRARLSDGDDGPGERKEAAAMAAGTPFLCGQRDLALVRWSSSSSSSSPPFFRTIRLSSKQESRGGREAGGECGVSQQMIVYPMCIAHSFGDLPAAQRLTDRWRCPVLFVIYSRCCRSF